LTLYSRFVSFVSPKVKTKESKSEWESTRVQNLIRYRPSGTFFARFKVGGKLIRRTLDTTVFSVAELRLPDKIKEHRAGHEASQALGNGKMTFGDVLKVYRAKIEASQDLKPKSKYYYGMLLDFMVKSWPGLEEKDIRSVAEKDCAAWLGRYQKRYAPSVVNNSIGLLRAIFKEAVDAGARFGNPAVSLKRMKLRPKKLKLPSRDEFSQFVKVIETGGSRDSKNCADLVRFLAYSGLRIGESKFVTWRDVDFSKKLIHVRGDPVTGTKNSEHRVVPMIPELLAMLTPLREQRKDEAIDEPIMRVNESQKSMDRAAKIVGMERITHHDLRHLFATICIESGVDIPTVSRWLGHKDGGALAMKVYGHLRDEHSATQAQRVKFAA
jgi:integrase